MGNPRVEDGEPIARQLDRAGGAARAARHHEVELARELLHAEERRVGRALPLYRIAFGHERGRPHLRQHDELDPAPRRLAEPALDRREVLLDRTAAHVELQGGHAHG